MGDNSTFEGFLSEYVDTLGSLDYKIGFFKNLSDEAYTEMTQLLPKINSNLKKMVAEIENTVSILRDSGLSEGELKQVSSVLDELKNIPAIILEIMTSLQVQDSVEQCISHIMISIRITDKMIGDTDSVKISEDTYETVKYLKIMPELIVAQLENIYKKMDDNLCYLPRKFQAIFEILRPPITIEELSAGGTEKDKLVMLTEELKRIVSGITNGADELKEKLVVAIDKVNELEKELPENTKMLDLSTAAPRKLQQPLTEILFLNDKLTKTSETAEKILNEIYDGDQNKIDSKEKLTRIAGLFSTKDEVEIARRVLKDIALEQTGEEGELELF